MKTIANLIVLIFEVIFYSKFIKNCKNEGKLLRYIVLFCLVTLVGLFISTNSLLSYLLLVIMIMTGLKYIVRVKTTFFDMFVIIAMLIVKTVIELLFCMVVYTITKNTFISLIIANVVKIVIASNHIPLNNAYRYTKKMWDNNNFYIRYILMCLLYIYVICSVLFLIYR